MAARSMNILGIVALGCLRKTAHVPIANNIILKTKVINIPLHSVLQESNIDF